jgi:2-amino-4-hydroxy-6-hydroxymethyldihydropteridine diphosphokinase
MKRALGALNSSGQTAVRALSSIYKTEPQMFREQDFFLNCVCEIETSLAPTELLHLCQSIEIALGREATFRYGPRTMDIDILLYDNLELATVELAIPHPWLTRRNFALIPLHEIAPNLVIGGKKLEYWLDLCKDQEVTPVGKIEIS